MSTIVLIPFGILDSLMKDSYQDGDEALLYRVQILEGQLAFVELTVEEYLFDNCLNMSFDPLGCRVFEGSGSRFNGVGEHHYACLFGLRFRA